MEVMTSSGKATVILPSDSEILISREFDAPACLVYQAFTQPDLIERWWAGKRRRATSVEADLRVGGPLAVRHGRERGVRRGVPRHVPGYRSERATGLDR